MPATSEAAGTSCASPVSKATAPVRGMVTSQATSVIETTRSSVPNQGAMGRVSRSKVPPRRPTATTPKVGSSIPVTSRPSRPHSQSAPV